MSSVKPLDPENLSYDTDGDSDTDESITDGSSADSDLEKSVKKEKVSPNKVKKFRRPILFNSDQVMLASPDALITYMELNTRILDFGISQQLPDHIINVAIIYALRFQMMCPRNNFSITQKAAACIFLASKSEDSVRRLDSILTAFYKIENMVDTKSMDARKVPEVIKLLETYVLTVEGFQVNMRHPHRYLEQYDRKLRLTKKILTTAHFITTAIIQMTLSTLQYPMNHVGATALHVAAEWCNTSIESPNSQPWYQIIESNKDLNLGTIQKIKTEFKQKWTSHYKHRNRLLEWKRKKLESNHKIPSDAQYDKNRIQEKRKDAKGNWLMPNSNDRRDYRNMGHPMDRHNWVQPRKPTNDCINPSSTSRSRPNSMSPSRHCNDDRYSSHPSHGRYSSSSNDKTVHISPTKHRGSDHSQHHFHNMNSFPGHKRPYEGGTGEHHHQTSIKHRKL